MRTELGLETIILNIGQERTFINIDKNGKQIGEAFTLSDYLKDPSLATNRLFANGIMNNLADAKTKAVEQLALKENGGNATILYDPSAKGEGENLSDWEKFKSLLSDLGEVGVNYAGANVLGGLIQTKGQATDEKFLTAAANNAKANGETITLAGHSGGGLRNLLTLQNAAPNQFAIDANLPASAIIADREGNLKLNSVLAVQFSGTPANYQDLLFASSKAGVGEVAWQNNSGDTVGNVLGMNGSVLEGVWSAGHVFHLFEPESKKLGIELKSPHAHYDCILSSCGSITNFNLKLEQSLLRNSSINSN